LHQHTGINLVPTLATQLICETIRARCRASVDAPSVEKIFVSRRSITKRLGIRYRGLTNEDELCEALAEKGFAIVEPEQLSFQDQVRLFDSAKIVVGLGGAGMFNVLFSRPGTRVITIESNAAFVHDHAALFASLALDYGVIFGLQDESCNRYPHNPWSLDVPAAVRHILAAL
jgi:capsular polysaccharide biosynthesis protein